MQSNVLLPLQLHRELILLLSTVLSHSCGSHQESSASTNDSLWSQLDEKLKEVACSSLLDEKISSTANVLPPGQSGTMRKRESGDTDGTGYRCRGSHLCCLLIAMFENVLSYGCYGLDERMALKEFLRKLLSLLVSVCEEAKETAISGL